MLEEESIILAKIFECQQYIGNILSNVTNNSLPEVSNAYSLCSGIINNIGTLSGGVQMYDIRLNEPYDFSSISTFLNSLECIEALSSQNRSFSMYNSTIEEALNEDYLNQSLYYINQLLQLDISCLFYYGNFDAYASSQSATYWLSFLDNQYNNILQVT